MVEEMNDCSCKSKGRVASWAWMDVVAAAAVRVVVVVVEDTCTAVDHGEMDIDDGMMVGVLVKLSEHCCWYCGGGGTCLLLIYTYKRVCVLDKCCYSIQRDTLRELWWRYAF